MNTTMTRAQIEDSIIGAQIYQQYATPEGYAKAELHIEEMEQLLESMPEQKKHNTTLISLIISLFV